MKKSLLLSFFLLATLSCITKKNQIERNCGREYLKELFISKCISYGYPEIHFSEFDSSETIYFDLGSYSYEAYRKIDSLAKDFVSKIDYKGTYYEDENLKFIFFDSFYFSKSDSLDHFIDSLDKYMCKKIINVRR